MGPQCKYACFLCNKATPFDLGPPAELLTVGDLKFWLRQYRENSLPKKVAQDFYNIVLYCLLKELPNEVFQNVHSRLF